MFPQRFLDVPSGYDIAVCARYEKGIVRFDFLNGTALLDGKAAPAMRTAQDYREWLESECNRHQIPIASLEEASMRVEFVVSDYNEGQGLLVQLNSAHFYFSCESCVRTDEKSYTSRQDAGKHWGYGWYWEQLYGRIRRSELGGEPR